MIRTTALPLDQPTPCGYQTRLRNSSARQWWDGWFASSRLGLRSDWGRARTFQARAAKCAIEGRRAGRGAWPCHTCAGIIPQSDRSSNNRDTRESRITCRICGRTKCLHRLGENTQAQAKRVTNLQSLSPRLPNAPAPWCIWDELEAYRHSHVNSQDSLSD